VAALSVVEHSPPTATGGAAGAATTGAPVAPSTVTTSTAQPFAGAPGSTAGPGRAGPTDGRARRRVNSYERAVDALLDLIEAGNDAPTAQQIAERSGISVRTVFRLTEDIESLHAAAVMRQVDRTAHLYVSLPKTGTFESRLRALVKNRVTVFETIAPVRRVGDRLAATSQRIAEGMEFHKLMLRSQVLEVFEQELGALPRHRRPTVLDAAEIAAGWEIWDQLRRSKGLSVTSSARVMTLLVRGALRG
jgi:AcrR family transcriptional regulator